MARAVPPDFFSWNYRRPRDDDPVALPVAPWLSLHRLLPAHRSLDGGSWIVLRKEPLALFRFDSILKHAPLSGAEA